MKLAVALALALSCSAVFAAEPRPNVLIILADDMGYGDPSCYNPQSKIALPNIDRLAREGMRFTDAHTAGSLCHPSRYGLLTGQYAFRTDVERWPAKALITEGQTTIASLLRSAGYRTAMVGKWHLGFDERGYDQRLPGGPVAHGFERFFGFRASTDIPPYFYIAGDRAVAPPTETIAESAAHPSLGFSPVQGRFWRGGGISPGLKLEDVLPRLADEAVSVIRDHGRAPTAPLFLYVALTGPHTPWLPSEEFRGRTAAGAYGDFSMMVDAMIGRVLEALATAGQADNTIVIFTSDNGPVWYPADKERTGHDSAGGLRGMKGSNWEGGHRTPFIVRWPGRVARDSVSSQLICFTDVMATLAEAVGATLPTEAGADSLSFLPVLLGRANAPIRDSLVVGQSLRVGAWKWIEGRERRLFQLPKSGTDPAANEPAGLLYNLMEDPRETTNLAASRPEVVGRMTKEFERIRSSRRTRSP